MRIATGAPLPVGTDSVVRVEDVFVDTTVVGISRPVPEGTDVVDAGEDISAGTIVGRAGEAIDAATLGVLAALGEEHIPVYRRPTVALISTGDEVVPVATSPRAGEVRDSNRVALTALLRSFGVETVAPIHVRDERASLAQCIAEASEAHDAVVISGGSSVGARDLTTDAVSALKPGVIVHGVRMKPARPVLLAASGSSPIIGLPGNPTAAMLALMVLGSPIFAKLTGEIAPVRSSFGIAAEPFVGTAGWDCYLAVRIDSSGTVRRAEHFCSTFVSALLEVDGYVHVDAKRGSIAAGELVRVFRLP